MKLKNTIHILLACIFFSACVSNKKTVYFQNDEIEQNLVSNFYKTILKPDDLLQITVSSPDLEASKAFNLPFDTESSSYLIRSNGLIDFPVLGEIKVAGLSRIEAIQLLKSKLDPDYIKKPTINLRIINYSITVLGGVNSPGVYTIPNERITIFEAIGLAGDLDINGKREKVKVFREIDGQKKEFTIDIRSNKAFTSPVYYLQQNDLIYIESGKTIDKDVSQTASLIISITTFLITLTNFIL